MNREHIDDEDQERQRRDNRVFTAEQERIIEAIKAQEAQS